MTRAWAVRCLKQLAYWHALDQEGLSLLRTLAQSSEPLSTHIRDTTTARILVYFQQAGEAVLPEPEDPDA